MAKFFNNIRKTLLKEGKIANYLKYAIGEIVLVVIGILIALQVNNWNENRKERVQERKILVELKTTLQNNCNEMVQDSLELIKLNKSSDIIISALQNDLPYSDSLNIHFQYARIPGTILALSSAGYEGLKNAGFNIITSDTLRNNIVELFEVTQKNLFTVLNYFQTFQPDRQKLADELFSYDDKKFESLNPTEIPLIPHNYNALKKDTAYMAMIKSVKVQRKMIAVNLFYHLKESRRVLQLIENKLNKNKL